MSKTTPKDPLTGRALSDLSIDELNRLHTIITHVIAKKAEEGKQ